MNINWDILVPGPDGLMIPTYGNYGGLGYSDGEILKDPNQKVDYSENPVDALDALFKTHDMAYDSTDTAVRARGDANLAKGIAHLSDHQLDAEASLYGGFATLFAIYLLVDVNQHPEKLTLRDYAMLTRSALHDIERGLTEASPAELADIANWLRENAGENVGALAGIEQVFDFSHVPSLQMLTSHAADWLHASVISSAAGAARALVHDATEAIHTAKAEGAHHDLHHAFLQPHGVSALHLDWLI